VGAALAAAVIPTLVNHAHSPGTRDAGLARDNANAPAVNAPVSTAPVINAPAANAVPTNASRD